MHLEWLFKFGYRPDLHRDIKNGVGSKILEIKREETKRAEAKAKTL